jgi:hypothetical protein
MPSWRVWKCELDGKGLGSIRFDEGPRGGVISASAARSASSSATSLVASREHPSMALKATIPTG